MSLLVWLPLTKDIKNYGLSDIDFKTNGATLTASEGKIGQCHYLNGKTISCSIGVFLYFLTECLFLITSNIISPLVISL